jgi:hypothetical protein
MSRRVTTKTEIKDKDLAVQAMKAAGLQYQDQGESLYITSGSMRGATLDLRSGSVSGDSDYGHTTEGLGALSLHYGEAKYRRECLKQGISIESRTILKNGEIELICNMA